MEHPVLERWVIRPDVESVLGALYLVMARSPKLQMVDIPTREKEIFFMIALLSHTWPRTGIIQVTLYEHNSKGDGMPLVKLQIGRKDDGRSSHIAFNILEWNYDKVSQVLEGWVAYVLAIAMQSPRARLASFVLNASLLTAGGLGSVHQVLEQSGLQFLHVECGAFDPSLENDLGQVLKAVNWSTLKSLELFGDNIAAWIDLFVKCGDITKVATFEVQLFRLSIVGTGGQKRQLSHSSALWIHDIIYLFSPVEVHLKNIQMQEAADWDLIQGAIDDSVTERVYLHQLQHCPEGIEDR